MDATSFFDCWDWPYEVDTYKYGRDEAQRKLKNAGRDESPVEIKQ
jgi:hypothetical protein